MIEEPPVEKRADTSPEVHKLIRARWSPRSFSDRPVSDGDLKLIFEAARWAASSGNEQPWRFIVARKSDPQLFEKMLGVLLPGNQKWAKSAPVLLLTVAKRDTKEGKPNRHAWHDTGAALAHIFLQATALGLHAHGMAGFDPERARTALKIPEGYDPVAAVAIGYLDSPDKLDEPYRERERTPRTRKPLSEITFNGTWDTPLEL
ncbi:MAG TPA: nitroreductase family protein [Bryobacteraceae bacterium]|jgi:nitroreductase|nr:nitroreductase family protein [Bryobacteraceae bacterium]